MNPSITNQDEHVTIDIQNEVQTAEPKNSNVINTTTIVIDDVKDEKDTKESIELANAVRPNYNDTNGSKEKTAYGYFKGFFGKKGPEQYWVQFNIREGSRIPDGGGPPLYYEPDRNIFVRMVLAIVLVMLILTAGFVICVYTTSLRSVFLRYGLFFLIIGMVGMICLNYAMMCSACSRMPPCNFICLFLAVCFMSLIAAYITARYRTQIVMLALVATTITVLVCLGLACTSFDFTQFLLYVIVIATAFGALVMIIGITMLVTGIRYKPLTLAILVIGTIINVVVLTIELQMILGGRTVELSEDDYALGAFMVYTSIVDIFLKFVQILGILDEF